jgi:hypothetical protein
MRSLPGGAIVASHSLLPRTLIAACFSALALIGLAGCRAPQTNTVVAKAESPDGKHLALLVDRYFHAARISDEFFLIVVPTSQDVDQAINSGDIDVRSVLMATYASRVRVRWQDNDTLVATCDSCGLRAIDVIRKRDHLGSLKVIYQGFPEHTAYH